MGYFIFSAKLENKGNNIEKSDLDQKEVKAIASKEDLKYIEGDYFIFSDFVYNLKPLFTSHPGGSYIAYHLRGREVDRFLYGMEPLEN